MTKTATKNNSRSSPYKKTGYSGKGKNSRSKKNGKGGIIAAAVILCILLAGVIALLGYLFYGIGLGAKVVYDGVSYKASFDGAITVSDETNTFKVQSALGTRISYSVTVESNPDVILYIEYGDERFDFYSDDTDLNDYSDVFSLEAGKKFFSISVPTSSSVQDLIEEKYGGEVNLIDDNEEGTAYFRIVVTAGKTEISLPFTYSYTTPYITLTPSEIIF